MKGILFSIKKYAIHDGPGIRVTFFLKGCPLTCWWCHNPEGISPEIAEVERIDRIGDKEYRRMEKVGKEYSVGDLVDIAGKERVFFEHSGGGVTFSGGEPMMQHEFLKSSLSAMREAGIHTVVDTSGMASENQFREILPLTSLFLYDLKFIDDKKHRKYTGADNRHILNNYRYLIGSGARLITRIPVIPGFNDDDSGLREMQEFIGGNLASNMLGVDLLPFHRIGSSKYGRFGMEYSMGDAEQLSSERMQEIADMFTGLGVKVKIGG
ncbi:MAG: glycyl-radical enzyme activating protein [Bacteroidales bacterium]